MGSAPLACWCATGVGVAAEACKPAAPATKAPKQDRCLAMRAPTAAPTRVLPCRYDIGATSGALVSMTSQQWSGTDWYSLSAFQSGLVVSLSLAGALLGSGAWCVVQLSMVRG